MAIYYALRMRVADGVYILKLKKENDGMSDEKQSDWSVRVC